MSPGPSLDEAPAGAPIPEQAGEAVGQFLGLPPLDAWDLQQLGIALAVVVVVALVGRLFAGKLRAWLERAVAPKFEAPDGARPFPSRHVASAAGSLAVLALLGLSVSAYGWGAYSVLLFDIGISLAAAVVISQLAGALNFSPSTRLALAIVIGFQVLASRYEQLAWVRRSLDSLAITIGQTRISMLDLVTVALMGIVLYAVVRIVNGAAKAFIRRRSRLDITQSLLAEKVVSIAVAVAAIFVAIDMLGIDTTALSVFSGTVGLGLGFGLQKIFSNLVSGIILLMDRSIKPGDVIVVADAVGEVRRIGTRAVSVITRDGKEHLIPNELLMTERVENWNFSSRNVRIRMSIRVAYESDLGLVKGLLTEATRESPRVLNAPSAAVRITDISENGIKLELRFWIRDPEDGLGNIQSEIFERILAKFRENGVVMPNPGQEVAITRVPPITIEGGGS